MSLKSFEEEFGKVKKLDIDDYSKNIKLSAIMTRMEQEFKIPLLNDETYNSRNKKVITLYRQIERARNL